MSRAQQARAWAERHMEPGDHAGDCYYCRSGWAIYCSDNACTCREVPKSYAPFLAAPSHTQEGESP